MQEIDDDDDDDDDAEEEDEDDDDDDNADVVGADMQKELLAAGFL